MEGQGQRKTELYVATGVGVRESGGEKWKAVGVDEPLLVAVASEPRGRLGGVGVSCPTFRCGEVDSAPSPSMLDVESALGRTSAEMVTPPEPV